MADNPNPGAYEGGGESTSDDTDMTAGDADESAYDAWDEREHGISEASRTGMGTGA